MEDAVNAILKRQGEKEMESIQQSHPATAPKRVFEAIAEDFAENVKIASKINTQSTGLVSKILGISPEPEKEQKDTAEPPKALTDVLGEMNRKLNTTLIDIEQNLERLESAW